MQTLENIEIGRLVDRGWYSHKKCLSFIPALAKHWEIERWEVRKETWLDIFLNVDYERSNVLFSQVEMKKTLLLYTDYSARSLYFRLSLSIFFNALLCCLTIDWMSFAGDFCVRKYAQSVWSRTSIPMCVSFLVLTSSFCCFAFQPLFGIFLHFDDARWIDSSILQANISSAC